MSHTPQLARTATAISAALLIAASSAPARATGPNEPTNYKQRNYRSLVPQTLKGARVIGTGEARKLHNASETIFIDVLPLAPKPKNLPKGTVWRVKKRLNIPGSIWLPNVGYGTLNPKVEAWFRDSLKRVTGNNPSKPVLFYCLANCWMSWNAAKRALEYGYTDVIWYPDGTDGWTFDDLSLEHGKPEDFDSF